jgi:hypothetical protein
MKIRCLGVALVVAIAAVLSGQARAGDQLPPPTVFDGAYQGLLVGAVAGAATGYIIARNDTWNESGGWKPVVYGTGIGALAGSALGLTLGIVDMAQRKPHRNAYVMRDGLYGAGLGVMLGGIAGGLAALSTKKAENILLGGAIGALAGTVGGIAVGFVEGYRKYTASVAAVQQADGSLAFVPAVAGRF